MNYEIIYNNIISKARSETRMKGGEVYYENHHILPKSLGGGNEEQNLVLLTMKEHIVCHHLLWRFTKDRDGRKKMFYAYMRIHNSYETLFKRLSRCISVNYAKMKDKDKKWYDIMKFIMHLDDFKNLQIRKDIFVSSVILELCNITYPTACNCSSAWIRKNIKRFGVGKFRSVLNILDDRGYIIYRRGYWIPSLNMGIKGSMLLTEKGKQLVDSILIK